MPRYAEWNKFIGNLKTDTWGVTNVDEVGIAFEKATADVVPKSEVDWNSIPVDVSEALKQRAVEKAKTEVAREIFAEIERMCIDTFGNFNHRVFAELKKKYTGGESNV